MLSKVSIKLPLETGEQARILAHAMGETITDTLASLIVAKADALGIPLPLYGVSIAAKSDGIHVEFDDRALRPMSPEQAISFASTIENVVEGVSHDELNLDVPDCIRICRTGAGFALEITGSGEYRRTFARGPIRVLAGQLRAAAKQAAIYG